MQAFIILAVITAASAHMCLISPPQRGSMAGLNKAASSDCILLNAPCGRPTQAPSLSISAGKWFEVTFQKNLNHWTAASPGYFSIGVATAAFENYQELIRVADKGEASLTLYSANITVPASMKGQQAIIQGQYVTKNSAAPAVFYQCSDVFIN